jgi:phosphoribosylformylglycinamidine synthase
MKVTVVVRPKEGILDPQGEAVRGGLDHLGFTVRTARVGRVIDLELEVSSQAEARSEVEEMCRQLLANPLIEDYRVLLEEDAIAPGSSG